MAVPSVLLQMEVRVPSIFICNLLNAAQVEGRSMDTSILPSNDTVTVEVGGGEFAVSVAHPRHIAAGSQQSRCFS